MLLSPALPSLVLFAWFTNPLLLWGIGAASLPIIIHLLNKRKFREEHWAAMRFLLAAIRKNQRRVRIEQWLLLAIRTLLLILLALALARPVLESMGASSLLPGQRTHWVLVLDGSMSMDYKPADSTRFEQAKQIASRLVKDSRQGDAVSVVVMADPPRVVIGTPAFNHDAAQKEIEALTLPQGGTDLVASFQKIDDVLRASDISRKEVVILTDLQAASWRKNASKNDETLKSVLAKLEQGKVRSQVIDLGAPDDENRAVTELSVSPAIPTVGAPVAVRAVVKNFSRTPLDKVSVRALVGNQVAEETSVSIGPGAEEVVGFNLRFNNPAETVIGVSINDDRLLIDNVRGLVVPVRESFKVLLVDGDPKTEPFRSESDFLSEALSPGGESPGITGPIQTEVVPESQLARRDLAPFDAVILCNIGRFTDAEVAALESYLKQGGGVVVFGGDQVQADNYNRLLYADGKGLLPARFGPIVGDPAKQEAPFAFNPLNYRHPIVSAFAGQSPGVQASLNNVKTFRFHQLALPKGSTARVALTFSNDMPAVIEARRHRGRVVQVATTADQDWTTWPLHQSFVPVVEQMVMLAASGRFEERNVRVGQPLVQAFAANGAGTEASVRKPNGTMATAKLIADGDVSLFRFDETDVRGPYSVQIGPPLNVTNPFQVNPDPAESDLTKLDESALRSAMPGWKFVYDNDWKPLQESAAAVGQRGELHRPMLWLVLGLLFLESILAWKFGHHTSNGPWLDDLKFIASRVLIVVLLLLLVGFTVIVPWLTSSLPGGLMKLMPAGLIAPPRPGEAITPSIRFEQPWPQLVLGALLLVGALLVVWLYRREGAAPSWYKMLLAALRMILVLLMAFMLSEAVLTVERTGLPYFVIMADDSASSNVADQFEDPKTKTALAELAKPAPGQPEPSRLSVAKGWLLREDARLIRALEPLHRVKLYAISNTARPVAEITDEKERNSALEQLRGLEPQGDQSRLGDGVRQVLTELRGVPPTAVLLLSDGQTTEGEALSKVAELAKQKGVPLFTVGLGDAQPARDLELSDLLVDDVVFVDDTVRFEARLLSRGFSGQQVTITLKRRPGGASPDDSSGRNQPGEEVGRITVEAPPDGQPKRIEIPYRPKETGEATFTLEVEPRPRELQADNNKIERTINVREEKLKVLLVDGDPRYEFRYLKNFLEREKTVELHVVLQSSDPEFAEQDRVAIPVFPSSKEGLDGLFNYDVILMGDVDPSLLSGPQMKNLADFVTEKGGGLLFIAGQNFNPLQYKSTPLEEMMPVQLTDARDPVSVGTSPLNAFQPRLTVEGRTHPIFRFGDDDATSRQIWESLPPLYWYLEAPRKKPAAFVLAEHPEQGGPEGKFPLILYQFVGLGKTMFHAVDDTWRWRFRVGDRYFGRFWIQTIRFLARSKVQGQKQAELTTDRRRYSRNQPIQIQVRFTNPGLAPANSDIAVQIQRKGQGPRRLTLKKSVGSRNVFEGMLPQATEGLYEIQLLPPPTLEGGMPSTTFRVDPPAGELENVQMNEPELRLAAQTTGGQFFTPQSVDVETFLKSLPDPQKVPLDTDPPIALWNTWPIFLAFVTLIGLEWVLRKRKQMV